jgi:hypothetical protein
MWHIWGRGEAHTGFWWGNMTKIDHLEYLCIDGRIIPKPIFKKWGGGHGLDRSGPDMDRWWALVNAVMNLWVP